MLNHMMSKDTISVKDIMREVNTIASSASFRETLEKMICKETNSLVVVDEQGVFVAMVNARVLIERAIPSYINGDEIAAHYANEELFREAINKVADMPLEDFMDKKVETITANESLVRAAILATKHQQIRIPVLDDEKKPIGLLTRTELKQVIGTFLGLDHCFDQG